MSSTPSLPTSKIVVKPRTNRKRKSAVALILRGVQLLTVNGQHEVVKHIQVVAIVVSRLYLTVTVCKASEVLTV